MSHCIAQNLIRCHLAIGRNLIIQDKTLYLPWATLLAKKILRSNIFSFTLRTTLFKQNLLDSPLILCTVFFSPIFYCDLLYFSLLYCTLLYSTLLSSPLLNLTQLFSPLLYSPAVLLALSAFHFQYQGPLSLSASLQGEHPRTRERSSLPDDLPVLEKSRSDHSQLLSAHKIFCSCYYCDVRCFV